MNFQPLIFRLESPDSEVKFHQVQVQDPIQILESIKANYKLEEVEEIIFEDLDINEISLELRLELEKFINLSSLGFNRCNLKSLNNLPELKIQRFIADDNQLKDNQLIQLTKYNTLQSLSLINNQITSQESLNVFQRLQIVQLNIYGNPFKEFQRKLLFTKLHRMIYLDNLPINGSDVIYSGDYNDLQRIDGYIQQDLKVYEK